MSSRRDFFAVAGAAAAVGALAGCSVLTGSQLESDAEAAANAVSSMCTTLESVVPTSDVALLQQIEQAAVTAGQDATALGSLIPNSSATTAQKIAGVVSAITTYDSIIPTFFPASAPIVVVLNAALVLAQGLYADAGLTPPASARFATANAAMPLATARAVLAKPPVHPRGSAHR